MTTADDMAALAADFPAWHIWRGRSPSGALAGWHATARRRGAGADGTLGRLAAPDAGALRVLLGQQEALSREHAA